MAEQDPLPNPSNLGFVEDLYASFLADPESVSETSTNSISMRCCGSDMGCLATSTTKNPGSGDATMVSLSALIEVVLFAVPAPVTIWMAFGSPCCSR